MNHKETTPTADICLLLEGTWPYVRGGVSSWIHQMILGLPELTFSVMFIGGQRSAYTSRRYEVPVNVVHIEEVFLEDATHPVDTRGTPAMPTRSSWLTCIAFCITRISPSGSWGSACSTALPRAI